MDSIKIMANRAQLYPSSIERAYTVMLRRVASGISSETERQLKSRELLRLDSWSDDLDALIVYLLEFSSSLVSPVIFRLPEVYAAVSQFQDKQWRLVVKSGTGLTIPTAQTVPGKFMPISDPRAITARFGLGVDVYRSEPWLAELQKNWVSQNTKLIKTIPTQYLGKVEQAVRDGVLNGTSSREIAKQVKEIYGVTDRRAKIISRDQIGKANAELTQYRQEDLGVKKYKWVTAHDERVRGNPSGRYPKAVPSHYARDGKEFEWGNPPPGGHPGVAILCRCYADPIFE